MTANDSSLYVRDLRKHYGDVRAVDGLDLAIAPGECFGLLGPNGAGKTTTIEICEGLLPADSGNVEVLGRSWESDAADLRELLGIQLQDTQLSEKLTVDDTGLITFHIAITNRPALTDDMLLEIDVDTDNNPATGDAQGLVPGTDYHL